MLYVFRTPFLWNLQFWCIPVKNLHDGMILCGEEFSYNYLLQWIKIVILYEDYIIYTWETRHVRANLRYSSTAFLSLLLAFTTSSR